MKRALWITMLAATATGVSCGLMDSGPKPTALLGESLDGWDSYLVEPDVTTADVWSVENGILTCKGEPLGYLFTKEKYTSFELHVEWRWVPGTEPESGFNNGVLLRVNGEPTGVPRCIEAQLKSGDAGDLYGFHGMKIDGDPARKETREDHPIVGDMVAVKKMAALENPVGEWNTYDITAAGPSITVLLNGKKANEAMNCDVLAGPIALQSEGGQIQFRNITILPLD